MAIKGMMVDNQWWASYGAKVEELLENVDRKRFLGTYEGDIDLDQILFLWQGMIREADRLQTQVNQLKGKISDLETEKTDIVEHDKPEENKSKEDFITEG